MKLVVPVMRLHDEKDPEYKKDYDTYHKLPKSLARRLLLERHVKDE